MPLGGSRPCLDRLWTRHFPYLLLPSMGISKLISPSSKSCCIKCRMNMEYNCMALPIRQPSCWSEIWIYFKPYQGNSEKRQSHTLCSAFLLVAYLSHFWNHGFTIHPSPKLLKVFYSVSVEWKTLIRWSTTLGGMWRVLTLVMSWRSRTVGTRKKEKEALLCMN